VPRGVAKVWRLCRARHNTHSFSTYHLAMHEDARLTEMQLGHRSDDLLYTHYRALATKAEARKYWAIAPVKLSKLGLPSDLDIIG